MKNLNDINYWKTKEKLIDWVYEYKPKELNFHFDYSEFKSLTSAVLNDFH